MQRSEGDMSLSARNICTLALGIIWASRCCDVQPGVSAIARLRSGPFFGS